MRARLDMARAEDGFAMIAALMVLVVLLVLGTAAVAASLSGVHSATRGEQDMQALEAAEGAADLGWNRMNLVSIDSLGLSTTDPCLSWALNGDVTAVAAVLYGSESWCPATSVPQPGASSATYQYSQLTTGDRFIVGTATVGNVTRRVELTLNQTSTGTPLFGPYAVESNQSLDFPNGAEVNGAGVRTNGSIELQDTEVKCHVPNGPITPGPGYTVTETNNAGTCGQSTSPAAGSFTFPSLSTPTSSNDSGICTGTTCSGGTISWSLLNLSLTIQNGGSVTLTGNTYEFCSVNIQNGTIYVHPSNGKPVEIFFLPPASCLTAGMTVGSTSLNFQNSGSNGSWIDNETGLGAAGLQIYLQGTTDVTFENDAAAVTADIYAPAGTVALENSSIVDGAIAANSVTMNGSYPIINYDSSSSTVEGGSGNFLYGQTLYAECTPAPASGQAPDNGCPT
jgi:Tfp pilus assembly protein PilX